MDNWTLDEYGCWILRQGDARVWIQKRPAYCDRGHYSANVDGIPYIVFLVKACTTCGGP